MINVVSGLSPCVWHCVYSVLGNLPAAGGLHDSLALAGGAAGAWVAARQRLPSLGWLSVGAAIGGVLMHAQANQWLGERLVMLGGWLITL